jgi:hypothetical protein
LALRVEGGASSGVFFFSARVWKQMWRRRRRLRNREKRYMRNADPAIVVTFSRSSPYTEAGAGFRIRVKPEQQDPTQLLQTQEADAA